MSRWYILLYHEVNWTTHPALGRVQQVCNPGLFEQHLTELSKFGQLESVDSAYKKMAAGHKDGPLISVWFDDGFKGVRKYAAPILKRFGVTGASSVSDQFISRQKIMWRLKLGYITEKDGLRFLRSRLKKFGLQKGDSIKSFTLNSFSERLAQQIDSLFEEISTERDRLELKRLFDDEEGTRRLIEDGWTITNHSSEHFPIGEESAIGLFEAQFLGCGRFLTDRFSLNPKYWVLPFSRISQNSKHLMGRFEKARPSSDTKLVLVGNKFNTSESLKSGVLTRIGTPNVPPKQLIQKLRSL